MEKKTVLDNSVGRTSESKNMLKKYYSVQFYLNGIDEAYLFKLREIPLNGLCILVKENSPVLNKLKLGDILNMEYHSPESSDSPKFLKTQIASKTSYYRSTGHSLVGLSIIDNQNGCL
jgi:hypothetical protein